MNRAPRLVASVVLSATLLVRAALAGPDPTLEQGAKGDAVRILQVLLNAANGGEDAIEVDGAFGKKTEAALRRLQTSKGTGETGRADATTWKALHEALGKTPFGTIRPEAAPVASTTYGRDHPTPREVEIHILPEIALADGSKAQPLLYESKMTIDADGSGPAWKTDPDGQPDTSLTDGRGTSLDPTVTPYFVLPLGFEAAHAGVHLGDVAAVLYEGKVTFAIYGDEGPRGQIGEGSIALAKALGIDPSPTQGGTDAGVIFIVFPGSGNRRPLANAAIDKIGRDLFKKAGGNPG